MQLSVKINGLDVLHNRASSREIIANRNMIMAKAHELMKADVPKVDCPVKHRFAPGVYIREITMPADTFIIGKIHATEHFNEVISGECRVFTPKSRKAEHHKAGDIFISEAGVQKVVYCFTDVVWRTVHLNPTNTQDLEKLEEQIISESYDELPYDQLIEECKRLGI